MANPQLFGFRKLKTFPWPSAGAGVTTPVNQVIVDLKDFLQREIVSRVLVRAQGNVTVAGAGPGTPTGRDNPEAIIVNLNARHAPTLGVQSKNNITSRGIIQQGIFDRGYSIHAPAIADAAAVVAVDFQLPLMFKQPGSVNPIEWGLPLSLFEQYQIIVNAGGRDQLFTGGTNTWDLTNMNIQFWADFDYGVAGNFHIIEEFENVIPVLQTQTDLAVQLERGFLYTHLNLTAERDNVKDNAILNSWTVQSAGRVWTPQGDGNAPLIQRWNRETHVYSAAEDLTGNYFIPCLRDGMYKRALDNLENRLELKFDVTLGGGTVRQLRLHGRRIIPLGLQVRGAQPTVKTA